MMRPSVTMDELWAAQAQFGPFGTEVIRGLQREWEAYRSRSRMVEPSGNQQLGLVAVSSDADNLELR